MKLANYIYYRKNRFIKAYQNHHFIPMGIKKCNDFEDVVLNSPDKVSSRISNLLESDTPCMISRFGSNELNTASFYKKGQHPLWFLRRIYPFWVPQWIKDNMKNQAGFFPVKENLMCDFADLIIKSAKEVDLLGSWVTVEKSIEPEMAYEICPLLYLEPYWSDNPWTRSLKDKKILVVHPFAKTIEEQYNKRGVLFDNPEVLPTFSSLVIIKAIQSIGGKDNGFTTWFDALRYMENQIDSVDYDIALIGCGAYGMPLAAHCKSMGKKAVHLGGALQLLFGIKGHRWEEDGYGMGFGFDYKSLVNNPQWVRPKPEETPATANQVEDACYW